MKTLTIILALLVSTSMIKAQYPVEFRSRIGCAEIVKTRFPAACREESQCMARREVSGQKAHN